MVVSDPVLVEEIQQLAGIVGIPDEDLVVTGDAVTARDHWRESELILIAASHLAGLRGVARRRGVVVLGDPVGQDSDQSMWSQALAVGADAVLTLPQGHRELLHRLREVAEGPSRLGSLVGVVGACGGAGSSTLAVGLALCAARQGERVLVMDADPLGGGLDLLLGAEDVPGARWPDLIRTTGQLSPATLDYALPHMNGVAVLAQARGLPFDAGEASPAVWSAVLQTAERGYDLVLVDIGRSALLGPVGGDLLPTQMQALVMTVPNRISAVSGAMRLVHRLGAAAPPTHLVTRQRSGGLATGEVADTLGLSPLGALAEAKAVAAAGERGELPGAYLRECRRVLDGLRRMQTGSSGGIRDASA